MRCGHVGARVGGEVDIPFAVDEVQFRRPDVMRIRSAGGRRPHQVRLGLCQIGQMPRLANHEAPLRGAHEVIEAVARDHPRIGPGAQQRIREAVLRGKLRACQHATRQQASHHLHDTLSSAPSAGATPSGGATEGVIGRHRLIGRLLIAPALFSPGFPWRLLTQSQPPTRARTR